MVALAFNCVSHQEQFNTGLEQGLEQGMARLVYMVLYLAMLHVPGHATPRVPHATPPRVHHLTHVPAGWTSGLRHHGLKCAMGSKRLPNQSQMALEVNLGETI